jgi:hypothetical protein
LFQQLRLHRRAACQIVPSQRRELRLEHAAKRAELFVDVGAEVETELRWECARLGDQGSGLGASAAHGVRSTRERRHGESR